MSEQTHAEVPEFHIGDRLEKALGVASVSHQAMAEYLGVSRNTIGNYIALRSPVSLGSLRPGAMRTGVPFEWLQNGVDPSSQALPPSAGGSMTTARYA